MPDIGTSPPEALAGVPRVGKTFSKRGTTMTCEGSAGGLGDGGAVCSTNQGAHY